MRAPWVRNHSTLRRNTGFRLRFLSHCPDPFGQSIKLFWPLAVAEAHQAQWQGTSGHMWAGNFWKLQWFALFGEPWGWGLRELPESSGPNHSSKTFSLWQWCWHPMVSTRQDEFLLQVFSSHPVFRGRPWSQKQEITIYFYLTHSTGLLREGFIAWLPKCRNYAELVSPEKQKSSGHF